MVADWEQQTHVPFPSISGSDLGDYRVYADRYYGRGNAPSTHLLNRGVDNDVCDILPQMEMHGNAEAAEAPAGGGQTVSFDYVNFDDPLYVSRNPPVHPGLSIAGLKGAFSSIVSRYRFVFWAGLTMAAD